MPRLSKGKLEKSNLAAGNFSSWLGRFTTMLTKGSGMKVPCGSCRACCTSSQFIHIGPDETQTLSRIPEKLLFPAPRLPRGYVLLGYDKNGHCPMLVNGNCSIYLHRPRTCRTYDCRLFCAAGIEAGYGDSSLIDKQVRRWRFTYKTKQDRLLHESIRAAAHCIKEHPKRFPPPANPSHIAVRAITLVTLKSAI